MRRASSLFVLILILVLAAALSWREETSLDYGFHVATGRFILERRAWPATDPFTYTVADHPYITMHGLVQVMLALADRWVGLFGVGLLRVAFVLGTTAVAWAQALRRGEAQTWYRRLLALDPKNRLARQRLAALGG